MRDEGMVERALAAIGRGWDVGFARQVADFAAAEVERATKELRAENEAMRGELARIAMRDSPAVNQAHDEAGARKECAKPDLRALRDAVVDAQAQYHAGKGGGIEAWNQLQAAWSALDKALKP